MTICYKLQWSILMSINREKCQRVPDYIENKRQNPPPMSFKVEEPLRKVLEDITEIITRKSPVEEAAIKAAKI